MASVKVENVSFWRSCGNVDGKTKELESSVGSALKAVAMSAQQYVTHTAQFANAAFSDIVSS